MKSTLSIIAFLLGCSAVMAQQGTSQKNLATTNSLIRTRGTNFLDTKPMYVVFANNVEISRGTMADSASLGNIKPADIESVVVLKDKSAISKYGTDATAGVVEIYLKNTNNPLKTNANNFLANKPLYVIFANNVEISRGTYADSTSINKINPDDIKSLNVLKDKTAITKYGVDATAGVIEVYLKDGKYADDYKKPEAEVKKN